MSLIQPDKQGKITIAKQRLRQHLNKLKNLGGLSASEREAIYQDALQDLLRIGLYNVNQLTDDD